MNFIVEMGFCKVLKHSVNCTVLSTFAQNEAKHQYPVLLPLSSKKASNLNSVT